MTEAEILAHLLDVMRDTLKGGKSITGISRSTTAKEINGWDSLSHAVLILNIESEFNIELPLEQTLELDSVGDLVDLISRTQTP
jgi:acyl carrier protein